MNLYSELQLSAKGSKDLINLSKTKKEKLKHINIYVLKVFLTVLFCTVFVGVFTKIFGNENGVAGVVIVLFLLTFRQIHMGYNINQSRFSILIFFIIFSIFPYFANLYGGIIGLLINILSIFILLFLGCYKVEFYNHATIVLSYLLLYGSFVKGDIYLNRVVGLLIGGLWVSLCLYRNHKDKELNKSIKDLVLEFKLNIKENLWKIKLAVLVSSSMYIGEKLGLNKVMWVGIATMSLLTPFSEMRREKILNRLFGTILGSLLFYIIVLILPKQLHPFIGIFGGLLVGFATSYKYQTVFNALGALSLAMAVYGRDIAIFTRIIDNIFAVIFLIIFSTVFDYIVSLKIDFNEEVIKI